MIFTYLRLSLLSAAILLPGLDLDAGELPELKQDLTPSLWRYACHMTPSTR